MVLLVLLGCPALLGALRASGPTPLSVPHVGNGQRDITPIRPVTPHRFVYLPPMNSAASKSGLLARGAFPALGINAALSVNLNAVGAVST
jgi:hypothetical protein